MIPKFIYFMQVAKYCIRVCTRMLLVLCIYVHPIKTNSDVLYWIYRSEEANSVKEKGGRALDARAPLVVVVPAAGAALVELELVRVWQHVVERLQVGAHLRVRHYYREPNGQFNKCNHTRGT